MRPYSPSLYSSKPEQVPRLRKWSINSPSTYPSKGTDDSDYLRESVEQLLRKRSDQMYPEIYDGVSSWSLTMDRLSKKATEQRHEIYDLQHKLRSEVEKNRDLAKIIHADRKQYREVISALTAKIEALELRSENPIKQAKPLSSNILNRSPRPQSPTEEKTEVPEEGKESGFAPIIADLNARLASVQAECDRLRKEQATRLQIIESENPEPISEAGVGIPASESTRSADNSTNKELRRIIEQNEELKLILESQAAELRHQETRYEQLSQLLNRSHQREHKADNTTRTSVPTKRASPIIHRSPMPQSVPISNPLSTTGYKNVYRSPESTNTTKSSMKRSPLLSQHDSALLSSSRSEPSTVASSTSTPPIKSKEFSPSPVGHRLDKLRAQLDWGRLSQAEVERYEDVYRNSARILAERPQLLTDTKSLVEELRRNVPIKHAALLSQIGSEVS